MRVLHFLKGGGNLLGEDKGVRAFGNVGSKQMATRRTPRQMRRYMLEPLPWNRAQLQHAVQRGTRCRTVDLPALLVVEEIVEVIKAAFMARITVQSIDSLLWL